MRRNNKICVGPPLSRNNVFYINDIEINALNINNCNIVYDSILSSQYPLFFKNLLRKNWWNLLLFFRSERKKGETVRKTSFDERNWFEPNLFPSRKKELSKYVWLLHSYISAMFFNYERNIYYRYIYIYIFKYVKHFSFFLSFNLASQMEKRATKKDHRGILDLWPFFFSFSRIREFRSHRERATCPIWHTLDLRDTYFSRVVDLFSIYLIVQFFRKRAKSRIPFSRQGVNKNN